MKNMIKKIKNKKGFTLLELLAVLIIIAILGTGLYFILAKVNANNDAKTEDKNIQLVAAAIRSTYGNTPAFTGLNAATTQQLITAGVFPPSLVVNNVLTNKWGGTITINSTSIAPGTDNYFDITDTQIPAVICNRLATITGASFPLININGTAFKSTTVTNPDPTAAVTLCNNSTNTIDFITQ